MEVFTEEMQNPWEKRVEFSRVKGAHIAAAMLVVALCALELACFAFEALAWIVLPVLFVYTVITVRSPGAVAVILVTAVGITFLTGTPIFGAVALSLIVGTGSLAWLLTVKRPPYLALMIPVAMCLVGWIITRDVYVSLLALAFLPAAILLAHATVTDRGRTSAILFAEGGLLISVIALIAVVIYRMYGSLDWSVITRAVEETRGYFLYVFLTLREEMILAVETTAAEGAPAMIENLNAVLSTSNITMVISLLFNLIPALLAVGCSVIAFEAHLVLEMTYLSTGWKQVLTRNFCVFTMSVTASILYYVSFLITMFVDGTTVFGAVMQNICLILLPGFCVLGAWSLLARIRSTKGGGKIFWILIAVSFVCCAGMSALYFLALWGANTTVMIAMRRRMIQKMHEAGIGKPHDSEDDDDPNDQP